MPNGTVTLTLRSPIELVRAFVDDDSFALIKDHEQTRLARYLLEFLDVAGAEIGPLAADLASRESDGGYSAVFPGGGIQVRLKRIVFDSVRDWVILVTTVAAILKGEGALSASVLGAAIAAFIRSALINTYRLDEHAGERCIVKAMLSAIRDLQKKRPIEEKEIMAQLRKGSCLIEGCQYQRKGRCRISQGQLKGLAEQLTAKGVLERRGASGFELPW